jgi:hypothetical protein
MSAISRGSSGIVKLRGNKPALLQDLGRESRLGHYCLWRFRPPATQLDNTLRPLILPILHRVDDQMSHQRSSKCLTRCGMLMLDASCIRREAGWTFRRLGHCPQQI